MRSLGFALLLGVAAACGYSRDLPRVNTSGGALEPDQACYDVLAYDLTLAVDPETRTIEGDLTARVKIVQPTDRLRLDLDRRFELRAVEVDGRPVAYERPGDRLRLWLGNASAPGAVHAVRVAYGGSPRVAPKAPWEGGFQWEKTPDGRPWIVTCCQGEGADLWWPCKDHPSDKPDTMELRITVPAGLVCAANGTLVGRADRDGRTTFHWRVANPISNYTVALNIGPYEEIKTEYASVTGQKVPVSFWVLPQDLEKGKKALPAFLDHVRVFEELCGPYPFRNEKYGVVQTPHLGMEHQTIIAYGNCFRADERGYDWLHNHELSHEWWGNLATCRDWSDMWIHEGIGTYMQALYLEKRFGAAAYRAEMQATAGRIQNRRPVAPRQVRTTREIYFHFDGSADIDIYMKGSWFMHTLRWLVGDEPFFKALRRMAYPDPAKESVTDGSQVRLTDTEEIRAIAEKATGRDLGWLFEVYLRQPVLPELRHERAGSELKLWWESPLPFPMPVPVSVGGKIQRVEMEGGRATLTIPADAAVVLDPEERVLRKKP